MFELNRIRLCNIGPRGARYNDVILDFSGGGVTIPQTALVPLAGQVSRRPAPASLLVLVNGGGKSVLINKILSTVLPRRQTKTGRGALKHYVLSNTAPSHVLLEWIEVATGRTLVTGQMLVRDGDKLERTFYSLRPNAEVTLATMPLAEDDRWTSFQGVRDALMRLHSGAKDLEYVEKVSQDDWENHLRGLGLEPDLFAVQQAMNIDEGDAADAFKRSSGKQFVQWFLERALDADRYGELTEAYTAYATNIGRDEQYRLERAFSQAMEVACRELADRHKDAGTAQDALTTALTGLAVLSSAVSQALQASNRSGEDRAGDAAGAKTLRETREALFDTADRRAKEVRRRTLLLRQGELTTEQATLEGQLAGAEQIAAAWDIVPAVLEQQAAAEGFQQITDVLASAEAAAAPARRARDEAGTRYRAVLREAEREARTRATTLDETRAAKEDEATGLEREANDEDSAAGRADGEITQLNIQIGRAEDAVEAARDAGHLAAEHDVAEGLEYARTELRRTAAAVTVAAAERRRRDGEAVALRAQARALAQPATDARGKANDKRTHLERQRTAARILLTDPIVGELLELDKDLGTDPLTELDACANELTARAWTVKTSAETQLRKLQTAADADAVLVDALSGAEEGLLPPRQPVEHILNLLEQNQIPADSGWRWLHETVNPDRHAQTIQAHPDLLDGVVVANTELLERAREVIERVRPLPIAAITVAIGSELHAPAAATTSSFVIEPTPALHDLTAAQNELETVLARIEVRDREVTPLQERRDALAKLDNRIANWRSSNPAGTTSTLIETVAQLEAAADIAEAALAGAVGAADKADGEATAGRTAVEDRNAEAAEARRTADAMEALALQDSQASDARVRVGELEEEARLRRAHARLLRETVGAIRRENNERITQIERSNRDAADYAAKRAEVVGTDAPAQAVGIVDTAQLTHAQHAYDAAVSNYAAVEVGADLHTEAEAADKRLRDAGKALAEVTPAVVEAAGRLTADPAASEASSRDAARREAARHVQGLRAQAGDLQKQAGVLKEQLSSGTQRTGLPWIELSEQWVPGDAAAGEVLQQRAAKLASKEADEVAAAKRGEAKANTALSAARELAAGLDRVDTRLRDAMKGQEPLAVSAEPWPGTVEAANAAAETAIDHLARDKSRTRQAVDRQKEGVHELRKTLNNPRFDKLTATLKTQITALDLDLIPPRAQEWADGFRNRVAALSSDLDEADRNRALLVSQLKSYVDEALSVLVRAEKVSTLPDSAGTWAGRQVLRIRFSKPDSATLQARIGDVLDEHARSGARVTGLELVLRGVTNAVSRDFAVDLLKPSMGQLEERVPVENMKEVFSGGQELTGGIMLYCTLAAVRMATRGRRGDRYGGMLILDNPIGKANAEYLLTLQMSMAQAVGVQLIYTTGSQEDRVLATFPLRIQLRNDADRRTGTRYLQVTSRALGAAEQPAVLNGDRAGQVTAVRLMDKDPSQ